MSEGIAGRMCMVLGRENEGGFRGGREGGVKKGSSFDEDVKGQVQV